MADGAASGDKSAAASATVKSFVDPSFNIVKTIPQGIIELGLRGTGAVSQCNNYPDDVIILLSPGSSLRPGAVLLLCTQAHVS